ncbi:hypothetical protein Lser_V15G05365 [Lactuca serriola]
MGKINNFLGLNIRQSSEGIFINQEKYSRNLLENFGMTNSSKLRVSLAVGTCLGPSLEKSTIDLTLYRSMIGSLLYLTASRLDIMFAICNYARVFIQALSDVDLGGCQLDRKSTNGGRKILDGKLVSWQSNNQRYVLISTSEEEYVAAAACISQIIWIQSQLHDYAINITKKVIGHWTTFDILRFQHSTERFINSRRISRAATAVTRGFPHSSAATTRIATT